MSIRIKRTDVVRVRKMFQDRQNNICPLCNTEIAEDMAVLDHSHTHGYIRGVLCRNCNAMEGKILNLANRAKRTGTVLEWLTRLVSYETIHDTPQTHFIHHLHRTDAEKKTYAKKRAAKKRMSKKSVQKLLKKRREGSDND